MTRLNYDSENDILYLAFADKNNSYGEEYKDGYVFMRDFISNQITGLTIFDFMDKYNSNQLAQIDLPIKIDFRNDVIPIL